MALHRLFHHLLVTKNIGLVIQPDSQWDGALDISGSHSKLVECYCAQDMILSEASVEIFELESRTSNDFVCGQQRSGGFNQQLEHVRYWWLYNMRINNTSYLFAKNLGEAAFEKHSQSSIGKVVNVYT